MRLPKYSLIYSIGGPHPGIRSARLPRTPFLFWKGLENARTTPRTTPPLQCNHTRVSLFLVFRRCLSLPPPFIYFIHNSRAKTIILLISLLVHVFSLYGYFFFSCVSHLVVHSFICRCYLYTPRPTPSACDALRTQRRACFLAPLKHRPWRPGLHPRANGPAGARIRQSFRSGSIGQFSEL